MNQNFQWVPQSDAQLVLNRFCAELLARSSFLKRFSRSLRNGCGSQLFDWIDYLVVPNSELKAVLEVGFEVDEYGGLWHPGAVFPRIFTRMEAQQDSDWGVGIKVDSCVEFAEVHSLKSSISSEPMAPLRMLTVEESGVVTVRAVERHGCLQMKLPAVTDSTCMDYLRLEEALRCRRRNFDDSVVGFSMLNNLLDRAITLIGQARTADCFFSVERKFWMNKNRAARVQKKRQDVLGLGWANHDHHTYRCSRENFSSLISTFERLGLTCRERFHAGPAAGWGAQVMESREAGIVVFADVDMSPDEVIGDFSHDGLSASQSLGTVGMWCALHGDSLFEAGMHHLECQFDFEALADGLEREAGIEMMPLFSDLPHLRQQFTKGEIWPVAEKRIERLLTNAQISLAQAKVFRGQGAIGSHLENLERRDGYKGFNQEGINQIIAATDPRTQS